MKIKNFIREWKHNKLRDRKNKWDGSIKKYIDAAELRGKTNDLIMYLVGAILAGIIIVIILKLWNTQWRFMSFGLLSAIIMYYLKWLRKLIVANTNNDIDKL